jgi:hypothetical protein
MQRITDKQLDNLAKWLNELTGSPLEPYSRDEGGRFRANVGNYHISHAYGGVCLHRMVNEGGGVDTPLVYGHVPKRELFNAMHAFIKGMNTAKEGV